MAVAMRYFGGPEVLLKTCVAMKFVDDDDDEFTEFGKPVFQYITASICGGIYARVYCILYNCTACTIS